MRHLQIPWTPTSVNDSMANGVDKFEMSFKKTNRGDASIDNELTYCNSLKRGVDSLLGVHRKLNETLLNLEESWLDLGAGLQETKSIIDSEKNPVLAEVNSRIDEAAATVPDLLLKEEICFRDPIHEYGMYTTSKNVVVIATTSTRLDLSLSHSLQFLIVKTRKTSSIIKNVAKNVSKYINVLE